MKSFFFLIAIVCCVCVVVTSCKKTGFITDKNALVAKSADTLFFDTVFTTTGSVTKVFKIFNLNDEKLLLSEVKLMGSQQFFKMNVDGVPGNSFSNIEIDANDSIYVFVSVKIDQNTNALPFIVEDSIRIAYNGNEQLVQLRAYGKNARFLKNTKVTTDTVWTNDLPIVVLGELTVNAGKKLTINAGTNVYCHADGVLIVDGTLQANGTANNRINFRSDRLDDPYRDYPAGWPGINFGSNSTNNQLTYCNIRNAYQAIVVSPNQFTAPKLFLNQCMIDNAYDAGILSVAGDVTANNCLISNCGANVIIAGGGNYSFNFCTIAAYGNGFIQHKKPVLSVTDAYNNQTFPLNANFTNCIMYGEGGIMDDEVVVDKKGNSFNVSFNNILYRNKNKLSFANAASLWNVKPQFDSIDVGKNNYNFRLKNISPAVDAGINISGITVDLDGKPRVVGTKPDVGCFELQP